MNFIKSWNDRVIRIRNDRYVCLTDMAQACEKNVNDWLRLNTTKSYLETLSIKTQIPVTAQNQGFQALVEIWKGGNPQKQGTWAYPKVAIRFAQWCSDEFAVQVDFWIDDLLTKGTLTIKPKSSQPKLGAYIDRVHSMVENSRNIPFGYWCVLHESANLLIYVETVLKMPVDKADLLDGSIGSRWSKYREGKDFCGDRVQFSYKFPDGREVKPWAYQWKELEPFRRWLEMEYTPKYLPEYLSTKYGVLIHSRVA